MIAWPTVEVRARCPICGHEHTTHRLRHEAPRIGEQPVSELCLLHELDEQRRLKEEFEWQQERLRWARQARVVLFAARLGNESCIEQVRHWANPIDK